MLFRSLDLGCGEGRHAISAYMVNDVESVGIDLSLGDLETTRERFQEFVEPENTSKSLVISVASAESLPFADESFDKIICSEVLEHIPDYRGVLDEIVRVLKPDGVLAISVPRSWPENICWYLSENYHKVDRKSTRLNSSHSSVSRMPSSA